MNNSSQSHQVTSERSPRKLILTKHWEPIKTKLSLLPFLEANIKDLEQILVCCKQVLQLLTELNGSADLNKFFVGPSTKKDFFSAFLQPTIYKLLQCHYNGNSELIHILDCCLQQIILLCLQNIDQNDLNVIPILKMILNPSSKYYNLTRTIEIFEYIPDITPEHQKWLEGLKKGDSIKCLRFNKECGKTLWSYAIVRSIENPHYIKISLLEEDYKKLIKIDRRTNAHEIASWESRSKDLQWRANLKKGDEINILRKKGWSRAIVIEIEKEESDNIKICIVLKQSPQQPEQKKPKREWLSIYDSRISPISSEPLTIGIIDDTTDKLYNTKEKKLYAVERTGHSYSRFFIQLVNYFGKIQGFNKIYTKITYSNNYGSLCCILGKLSLVLHRGFALEYVPKLKEVIWKKVMDHLRSYKKPLYQDKINEIIQPLQRLLKRIYPKLKAEEMMGELVLNICRLYYDSPSLEIRLQGLNILSQLIKSVQNRTINESFVVKSIKGFLIKKNVFTNLYFGTDAKLLEQSKRILRFLFQVDLIKLEDFHALWRFIGKANTKITISVLKNLSFSSFQLKTYHSDYILKKIFEKTPQDLIKEDLRLIYAFCKSSKKSDFFSKKSYELYWRIIFSDSRLYNPKIVMIAAQDLSKLMKSGVYKNDRIKILLDCIKNFKKISVLTLIIIIRTIIDHYPEKPELAKDYSRGGCIEYIFQEKDLFSVIIPQLRQFKQDCKSKLQNSASVSEKSIDQVINDGYTYKEYITTLVGFISYLLINCPNERKLLKYEYLIELWDLLIENAYFGWEREVLLSHIGKVINIKNDISMKVEDVLRFFRGQMDGKMLKQNKCLTKSGYNFFIKIFLLVNEELNYIQITSSDSNEKIRTLTKVIPKKIEGIASIWNFLLNAEDRQVSMNARNLLQDLFFNLDDRLLNKDGELEEEILIRIRQDFLVSAFNQLSDILDKRNSVSKPTMAESCKRWLRFVDCIMDESEKNGIGDLRPHSKILKGDVILVRVKYLSKEKKLKAYGNTTIFQVLEASSKLFNLDWRNASLSKSLKLEIEPKYYGKTLDSYKSSDNEVFLTLNKKDGIPNYKLLRSDHTLNPKVKIIFLKWYEEFSYKNKMSPENYAAFLYFIVGDNCGPAHQKIQRLFEMCDDDKDGFITQQNFILLNEQACKVNPRVFCKKLNELGYRPDFRHVRDVQARKAVPSSLTRFMISYNDQYFNHIYSMLDLEDEIAFEALEFLKGLPTNATILREIIMLKGVRGIPFAQDRDWNIIFNCKSKYKDCYALYIVEYLMEETIIYYNIDIVKTLCPNDDNLVKLKKTWGHDFTMHGGLSPVFKILGMSKTRFESKPNSLDKNLLLTILRILENALLIFCLKSEVSELVDLIKKLSNSLGDFKLKKLIGVSPKEELKPNLKVFTHELGVFVQKSLAFLNKKLIQGVSSME